MKTATIEKHAADDAVISGAAPDVKLPSLKARVLESLTPDRHDQLHWTDERCALDTRGAPNIYTHRAIAHECNTSFCLAGHFAAAAR